MHSPLRHLAVLLGLLLPAGAQTPATSGSASELPPSPLPRLTLNHALVFLDPAHGGDDAGAHLVTASGEQLLEKDITLALANRLRFQLTSLGLTVLATREADIGPANTPAGTSPGNALPATLTPPLNPDQRAGLANHVRPFACIILHATETGRGVHLITSGLTPPQIAPQTAPDTSATPVPWDSAQAGFLLQSERLASELSTALTHTGLPVHLSRADIRPLDNLTCPAVLIELAPLPSASVADSGYQARVAQTVATALLFWRGHAEPELPANEIFPLPGAAQP